MEEVKNKLRSLPAIDRLLAAAQGQPDLAALSHNLLVKALRQVVDTVRNKLKAGEDSDVTVEGLLNLARHVLHKQTSRSLRRVINGTGVVLHTNLGRAPLSQRAVEAIEDVITGYSTLEYDVDSGQRGSRYSHVVSQIRELTGAEDVLVVNNNAAAVLLILSALTKGREVIVSRGQLVEIGGSFRIPDVMKQSGATLVEVGTTNKTHLADYADAITENTAAILKVHTSNYRIVGFTAQPDDTDLVDLAHKNNIILIDDLGSGTLVPIEAGGWREPSVTERIAQGFDLVTFSGDKLLGAGQAGIIAGKKAYIDKMKKNPLLRAFRIDKLSLAALEGTLQDYLLGDPMTDVPVHRMLNAPLDKLEGDAQLLARKLTGLSEYGWTVRVASLYSQAGGGSLPAVGLPGWGVKVEARIYSAATLEGLLRRRDTPIVVRIHEDNILFDVRTLTENDMNEIAAVCLELAKGEGA